MGWCSGTAEQKHFQIKKNKQTEFISKIQHGTFKNWLRRKDFELNNSRSIATVPFSSNPFGKPTKTTSLPKERKENKYIFV